MKNILFILLIIFISCKDERKTEELDFINEQYFLLNSHCDTLIDDYLNKYALANLTYSKKIDTLENGDLSVEFFFKTKDQLRLFICSDKISDMENEFYYTCEKNQYTLTKSYGNHYFSNYPSLSELDTIVTNYYKKLPYDTSLFRNWVSMNYQITKNKTK